MGQSKIPEGVNVGKDWRNTFYINLIRGMKSGGSEVERQELKEFLVRQ